MAKPYESEIQKLADTFSWAATVDIAPLQQAVRTAGLSPLMAIGSGGSLTAAYALAGFHQYFAGRIGTVATPLEATSLPVDIGVSSWLLSAGGGNVDILRAAKSLANSEPRQLVVLCGREDSPLAKFCREHPFIDLMIYPPPAGKDGFLATNSLLGFALLLARAYTIEFSSEIIWRKAVNSFGQTLLDFSELISSWKKITLPLWSRATTLVLHAPSTKIGAIDLESKFTEAALGNLQVADYRNFAHGRHHWLAKHGETSSVIAFVTNDDRSLAEKTLRLIPKEIPIARLDIPGERPAIDIASLVAALRIVGWAGAVKGIDPGRPGVPEFGRKLYSLPLPRTSQRDRINGVSDRDLAAISRKSGMSPKRLADFGELGHWQLALKGFRNRLCTTQFAGVVLDYDGTVVDTRNRFVPACEEILEQLMRIASSGALLAIATGRGASVRRDLQKGLPTSLWKRVLIGYYNGAEVATLDNANTPDGSDCSCDELKLLSVALRSQPELARLTTQTDRRFQITLEAKSAMPENRLWDLAHQVVQSAACKDVVITRSSHSIDIVAPGVTKLNVISELRKQVGSSPILLIGDRGRWPGNDCEMLGNDFSLSVDEVSVDPATCWNLSSPGQRGISATLEYLSALEVEGDFLRFRSGALE